jgi:hypothetical protein
MAARLMKSEPLFGHGIVATPLVVVGRHKSVYVGGARHMITT